MLSSFKNCLLLIILPVFLVANFWSAPKVAAQNTPDQGISLQISPLPIELTTKPGTSITTDLRVRNAGSQTEKLQVRILKVSADDNGNVHLNQPGPGDSFVNWISFDRQVFTAPPGAWQTVKMTVSPPKSAAFGYYFAVEYLRANAEPAQAGKAVARGAVATFVLLNADAPGAKRQAQIAGFSADRKSYEFLPAGFSIKIRSTGNVHVAPHGNIFILHGKKQIGSIQVNAAEANVLPDSSRFFSADWSDGFPVYVPKYNDGNPVLNKNGQPVKSLKWDFSKANHLRFGRYTAHLVMVYDDGQRDVPMDAYVSFWVVPWRLLAVLLIILLLVAIGLWSSSRKIGRFFSRQIKRLRQK